MSKKGSQPLEVSDAYVGALEKKLDKALKRLESTILRLAPLGNTGSVEMPLSDEDLGRYEEFMSRFARLSDIFMSQYLRARIKREDPAFVGTLLDSLHVAEKWGWIDSAQGWYAIRELRSRQAHEYEEEDLVDLFREALAQVPRLRKIPGAFARALRRK